MRALVGLSLLFLAGCEATPSKNPGPFEAHVLGGLAINQERMSIYEKITDSRSLKISKELIHQEKLSIGVAQIFDRQAQVYRDKGIPLLVDEFVSMASVPVLDPNLRTEKFDPQFYLKKDNQPKVREIKIALRNAYKKEGLIGLSRLTDLYLKKLEGTPQVFCMTRHFLESILRASNYGSLMQEQAEQIGETTAWLSWNFINLHLSYLDRALALDLKALPVQAEGIAILCQDLPKISAW